MADLSSSSSAAKRGKVATAASSLVVMKGVVVPAYVKAISGSVGGIVEASCLQPMDVIKTRLQLDRTGTNRGILHCGTTTARTEGVGALWKGLTPYATHLTLKYGLRMGSNALIQSAFKDPETGKISNPERFVSGFGAGNEWWTPEIFIRYNARTIKQFYRERSSF